MRDSCKPIIRSFFIESFINVIKLFLKVPAKVSDLQLWVGKIVVFNEGTGI